MFPVDQAIGGVSVYLAFISLLVQSTLPIGFVVLDLIKTTAHCVLHPLSPEQNMKLLVKVISKPTPPPTAPYVPLDEPPPTMLEVMLHPEWRSFCAQLDDYFVKNWPPFKDQKARDAFIANDINKWVCWCLPLVGTDRLYNSMRVNTLLFLLDDVAETMSLKEGKDFYRRLIPIAMGKTLPNRDDPYEWITYDTWAALRATDSILADQVLQQAFVCILAQVDEARLACTDMGALLRHRTKEAGIAFVAAVLRFGMNLHLSNAELDSIPALDDTYAKHGVTVNDICSFDKEVEAHAQNPSEGSRLLNMTSMLAQETGITYEAAKRILWILCREWEVEHQRLVVERVNDRKLGCSEDLKKYLKGLELVLGGNEYWSRYTSRYKVSA